MWRRRKHEMRSRHRWGELMVFIQLYFLHAVHIIHKDANAPLVLRFTPSTPNIHQARFRMLPPAPHPPPKVPERGITFCSWAFKSRGSHLGSTHKKKCKKERERKKKGWIKSTPSETWGNTISSCIGQQQMETLSPQKVERLRCSAEVQSSSYSGHRQNLAAGSDCACFSWRAARLIVGESGVSVRCGSEQWRPPGNPSNSNQSCDPVFRRGWSHQLDLCVTFGGSSSNMPERQCCWWWWWCH